MKLLSSLLEQEAAAVPAQQPVNKAQSFDQTEIISKLNSAEKSADIGKDTVAFGLEDDEGNVVKVYVRSEQADDFESALAASLSSETNTQPEIAEVLFDLREKFDIVDVVWPAIPEDEEQEVEVAPGAEQPAEGEGVEPGQEAPEGEGEGEMVAGEEGAPSEELGGGEEEAKTAFQQVIDMMKADASAREAEAKAKEAEAKAEEARYAAHAAEAKIKAEEQTLDMEDFYDKKDKADKEAKQLAKLAKYRHDLAREAQGTLSSESHSRPGKKLTEAKKKDDKEKDEDKPKRNPTTGVPLQKMRMGFSDYFEYAKRAGQAQR